MLNVNSYFLAGELRVLTFQEQEQIDGGIIPLLVLGAALLIAGCQSNTQGGQKNKQINIYYNGAYPDTTYINGGNGQRDTIINK